MQRDVVRSIAVAGLLAGGLVCAQAGSARAEGDCTTGVRLAEGGVMVQQMKLPEGRLFLQCRVALGSDVPEASYVIAHTMSNKPMKRDANGFWLAWDYRRETLIDNNVYDPQNPPADRKVLFKIINEDISGTSLPVAFHFGYVVGGVFKFGVISVEP